MACSCGDVMRVEAASRADAVSKMKALMTEGTMSAHMSQKHPGEEVPTLAQMHLMIEQGLKAAA
jgi:hypothetical protein